MDTRTGEELSETHRKLLDIAPLDRLTTGRCAFRTYRQALDAKVIRGNVGMARRTASSSIVTVLAALGP